MINIRRLSFWKLSALAVALVLSCGEPGGSQPETGTEGGTCFPNGTCNAGLTCASNLCVVMPGHGEDTITFGPSDGLDQPEPQDVDHLVEDGAADAISRFDGVTDGLLSDVPADVADVVADEQLAEVQEPGGDVGADLEASADVKGCSTDGELCGEIGLRKCLSDSLFSECMELDNGCLEWSVAQGCEEDEICYGDGQCAKDGPIQAGAVVDGEYPVIAGGNECSKNTVVLDLPWIPQVLPGQGLSSWTNTMCCGPACLAGVFGLVSEKEQLAQQDLKNIIDWMDANLSGWSSNDYNCVGTSETQMVFTLQYLLQLEAIAMTVAWCDLLDYLDGNHVVVFHGGSQGYNTSNVFQTGTSHWLILEGVQESPIRPKQIRTHQDQAIHQCHRPAEFTIRRVRDEKGLQQRAVRTEQICCPRIGCTRII